MLSHSNVNTLISDLFLRCHTISLVLISAVLILEILNTGISIMKDAHRYHVTTGYFQLILFSLIIYYDKTYFSNILVFCWLLRDEHVLVNTYTLLDEMPCV